MEKDKENYLVVQSNALIEAQYKLPASSQKIIRYLVSRIKPGDSTFKKMFYRLDAKDFSALIGREKYSGKDIEDIKTAADLMLKTRIKIVRGREITRANWLASYTQHLDEGWFEFEFSSKIENELLLIQNEFTAYHLSNISKLKSQYSIRLYELLKQYIDIGHRKILIAELKAMLGIEKSEYKIFTHIRQKILDPAHREILAKTDLDYQWKPFKHVRKIIGVEFYDIKSKSKPVPAWLIAQLPKKYQADKEILKNLRKWLELKGEAYCTQKIQYTTSQYPTKYAEYLAKVLVNDYGADFDQAQASLFPNPEKLGFPLDDGVQIEVDGKTFTVESGMIRTKKREVIPWPQIRQGIKDGKIKVIDVSG